MASLSASPDITSSINLPNISKATEDNGVLEFQVDNIDTSIINAIRRTLLSDIPCFVFKTFPDSENEAIIHKNTCRFHNEILKQRLGCIPIHIKDLETPVDNLRVIIKVKNDTDSVRYVTTNDFQIRDNTTGKFLSDSEVSSIFPPSGPPSNGFILFTRLRPKISESIPGEEVDIESRISISTAKTSGMYNMCSTATYMMTPDPVQQNANWGNLRDTLESQGFTPAEVERERQNWFTHDAKRIVKENSFIFKLESVGVYSNRELIQKACDIITEKLETVQKLAEQRVMEIITSKTTMSNCYDLILKNYDYTIGKILEYIIYTDYFKTNRRINFAGFIKEHPHDDFSIIRISFINQVDPKNEINDMIQYSCQVAKRIFQHIRDF